MEGSLSQGTQVFEREQREQGSRHPLALTFSSFMLLGEIETPPGQDAFWSNKIPLPSPASW